MSDVYDNFRAFYQTLPVYVTDPFDVTPVLRPCKESETATHQCWLEAMRPYTTSVFWLMWLFSTEGEKAAYRAFLKLGGDRRQLVRTGFAIVFENHYQPVSGFAYHRPKMFIGVAAKYGDCPVRIVKNMRQDTYRHLLAMGEVPA